MSAPVTKFTVAEKILLAAYDLDKRGESSFTAETLIVTSWKKFPPTFGLKGYADKYPDANKVLTSIMGERGLAKKGWLVKLGKKLYSLTREGRRMAANLLQEEEAVDDEFLILPRQKEAFLRALFDSAAARKFEEHKKSELTFQDACHFWDINQNQMQGEAVNKRLSHVEKLLNELEQDLAQQDAQLNNGRIVAAGDIRVLRHVHRYMEDRFERILGLLRKR